MSTGTANNGDNKRKLCGLVIRVSTARQADNPEGSLKNQLQRLRAHIDYKNTACGEKWVESEKYVLEAVSGKDSIRSREFARLFDDARTGRINTVICTSLDRISRSVKDFLNFFEYLNRYDVEFVCLKQNYDTTTAQGRLFVTMMMALAEFEREQTSERNREATLARAERGLWNGSQIFGYDMDPINRGRLIPNEAEAAIVNFAFDHYLKHGSISETAKELNRRGYRTKSYKSRRGTIHPAKEFKFTSVHRILHNLAYLGRKEINKKQRGRDDLPEERRYRVVKAVWPAIVDEEKFYQVAKLTKANNHSNGNKARPVRHNYLLNQGFIWCGKCGKQMEGRSGTSHRQKRYYYYACKNTLCRFRIPADEIENIVLGRLKELARQRDILEEIVAATNIKLRKELPQLKEQKALLGKELDKIKNLADQLLGDTANLATEENKVFLKEKLDDLAKRRRDLENGLEDVDMTIEEIERESVSKDLVKLALNNIMDAFDKANPYQQKQLLGLALHKVEISGNRIKLALRGRPPEMLALEPEKVMAQSVGRSAPSNWLPGEGSNL
ncbi:MAG: recombinase family protein [PVC group bacterium]